MGGLSVGMLRGVRQCLGWGKISRTRAFDVVATEAVEKKSTDYMEGRGGSDDDDDNNNNNNNNSNTRKCGVMPATARNRAQPHTYI